MDNRPLNFSEFMETANQLVYVSATPGAFEINNSIVGNAGWIPNPENKFGEGGKAAGLKYAAPAEKELDVTTSGAMLVVEQIIRPTGLLDPKITVRPLKAQIDETIELCRRRIEIGERILITTLTKKTAEDLADYLREIGLRVRYLHSDIDTIERVEILRTLRAGDCDILVGINLLREGLDLPEVSLVCILDADKEGYLRSRTSLIQTAGRAARHLNGEVVLFADTITGSMRDLLDITEYRRSRQEAHNKKHGITPRSVVRAVQESLHVIVKGREVEQGILREDSAGFDAVELIRELERDMADAASRLEYERAALLRDQIAELKNGTSTTGAPPIRKKATYAKASRKKRG
jgi:excinuclease ABC subunit B